MDANNHYHHNHGKGQLVILAMICHEIKASNDSFNNLIAHLVPATMASWLT